MQVRGVLGNAGFAWSLRVHMRGRGYADVPSRVAARPTPYARGFY